MSLLLAAGQLDADTRAAMAEAIDGVPAGATAAVNRIKVALALALLSPQYIVQK